MTTRRDPEARRQTIVEAAAALITEAGVVDLTHRKVAAKAGVPLGATTYYFASLDELSAAALELLGQEMDDELNELTDLVVARGFSAAALADVLHDYLGNHEQVSTDSALYFAGASNPQLREYSLRWFDGLVAKLEAYVSPQQARALAVFVDGAFVHAMLHDEPLPRAELEAAIVRLLG